MSQLAPHASPELLDDSISALVLNEMLQIGEIGEREIETVMSGVPLDVRGIAVVFRVSATLGIPAPFELSPVYRLACNFIDTGLNPSSGERDPDVAARMFLLAEALCVGVKMTAVERESLLLSVLDIMFPAHTSPDMADVLDAIESTIRGGAVGGVS